MSNASYQLGDRVRIHSRLHRLSQPGGMRLWVPIRLQTPLDGIVVGIRTLYDGRVRHGGWDETLSFQTASHRQALLVATDLRKRPVFVELDDVEAC